MSEQRRVVVTGLGIVSPLGNDLDSTWSNIISGKSGAGRITKFDPAGFSTTFAAELKGYNEASGLSPKEIRRIDPFIQYALTASDQAIKDSDLSLDDIEKTRIGVSIGSGIGGLGSIEDNALILGSNHHRFPRKKQFQKIFFFASTCKLPQRNLLNDKNALAAFLKMENLLARRWNK